MGLFNLFRSHQGSTPTSKKGENMDLSLDTLTRLIQSKASADKIWPLLNSCS